MPPVSVLKPLLDALRLRGMIGMRRSRCRPSKPGWTIGPLSMPSISSADRAARGARSGKLPRAERSALDQALPKALAFRDARKMQEA
jgi:hypothetical protein